MKDCPFCIENKKLQGKILNESNLFYLVESIDPVLTSAGMIIPKRHTSSPFELTESEWRDLFSILHETKEVFEKMYAPHGWNIGWNIGEVGGQNEDHLHLHVICRFKDEPLAGKGIRFAFKQKENKRPN